MIFVTMVLLINWGWEVHGNDVSCGEKVGNITISDFSILQYQMYQYCNIRFLNIAISDVSILQYQISQYCNIMSKIMWIFIVDRENTFLRSRFCATSRCFLKIIFWFSRFCATLSNASFSNHWIRLQVFFAISSHWYLLVLIFKGLNSSAQSHWPAFTKLSCCCSTSNKNKKRLFYLIRFNWGGEWFELADSPTGRSVRWKAFEKTQWWDQKHWRHLKTTSIAEWWSLVMVV